ncbi:MAG: BadF/BadG/BcrA/BcrD ATPase family protein, partial [bacterium]
RNPFPIEMAAAAREAGLKVIGVTSTAYSSSVSSRHHSGMKMLDLCDLVLDNLTIPGDAVIEDERLPQKVGPTSGWMGCLVLQALMAETAERLADKNMVPPIYFALNLDGQDDYVRYLDRLRRELGTRFGGIYSPNRQIYESLMRHFLGLDGGGSKTICLAANEAGQLLGQGTGGSINTNYVLRSEAINSLRTAISNALKEARLSGPAIDLVCVSAPMAPDSFDMVIREFEIERVMRAAEGDTPRWAAKFSVDGRVGLTVDAGTGAMARGWAKDGREAGASGWGATLGDEGSSYWIGINAMRAVLQAFDGRIKPTMLTEPILAHLGLTDMLDMVFKVDQALVREETGENQVRLAPDSGAERPTAVGGIYFREDLNSSRAMSRHEVASLCPVVAKVAYWGDWKAKEIFQMAGQELGMAGVAVIKRLEMEQEEFIVVPFGGVFRAGELVLGAFENAIQAVAPLARIVEPTFEPVTGAVLMALDQIGVVIDSSIISNMKISSTGSLSQILLGEKAE